MTRTKKGLYWVAGCFALLLLLLGGAVLLLPYLVNLEPVKAKVLSLLLKQVGGEVTYRKMDLFYLPKPGIIVHEVSFSVPEKVAGTVKSVEVYPELQALLKGDLRFSGIRIESPDFSVPFPVKHEEVKGKPEGPVLENLEQILARISAIAPSLRVRIQGGRLTLVKGSETVLSFSDIDASLTGPGGEAGVEITCRSNLWERMSFEAAINPVRRKGKGHIEVTRFQPHLLLGFLASGSPLKMADSLVNLKVDFETSGPGEFQATVEGSIPGVTFVHSGQQTTIKGKDFRAAVRIEGERIGVSLDQLSLEYPGLTLAGKFTIDRKEPLVVMEAQGREMDVASLREVALRLAGGIPVTKTIFAFVRSGRIPLITFQSEGRTVSELDDTERFSIRGSIVEGEIAVAVEGSEGKKEEFALEKTSGDVVISQGILTARNLTSQWKGQKLRGGNLKVGLEGEDAPFHVEMGVETELSLLPPLLRRLSRDQALLAELARIRQLEGRASGKIVLGESLKSIDVKVDIQDLNLRARHALIPFPISIDRGAVSFDGEKLRIRNLNGKVGGSSFSGLTAQRGFGREPLLQASAGSWVLSLEDLYPWLSSYDFLREASAKIQSVKGNVALSDVRLSGPLLKPEKWDFQCAGELRDLIVAAPSLPGPAAFPGGRFTLSPQKITFTDLQVKFLSASLRISCSLDDYRKGLQRAELSLSGGVTPKDIQWLSETLGLGLKSQLRSPVRISQAQLVWRKGTEIRFNGDLAVENGPRVTLEVVRHSQGIKMNHLVIRDDLSDASIEFDVKGRAIDLTFSGRLSERTLDRMVTQFQLQDGWIKGNFRAHVDLDRPMRSAVHGKVEASRLSFPVGLEKPLEIVEMSLDAKGDRISFARSNFQWGGKAFALSGDLGISEKRVQLDLDLFTESLDLKEVTELLGKEGKGQGLQVQGTVRFRTNSLSYETFLLSPFHADIVIDPQGVDAVVKEASLCGISTPGSVKFANQRLTVDLRPSSKGQALEPTFRCLVDREIRAKGDFDLKGRILVEGKPDEILGSLKGNMELQSKRGQLHYSVGLMRVLEFVNAMEIYRGKLPDLAKKGVEYNFIKIRATFQGRKVIIDEVTLDGTTVEITAKGEFDILSQEIRLTVLVAPLKTVDRIIKSIPLVGWILGGNLIAIPVLVHGSLNDPKVTPLSPSAVGSELLGMMKRTLGLPVKVMETLYFWKPADKTPDDKK